MNIKNKSNLYGVIATVLVATISLALSFIINLFWNPVGQIETTCFWLIKATTLVIFVTTVLLRIFTRSDKSLGAFAILGAVFFLIWPLLVRLLLLFHSKTVVIIAYILTAIAIVVYLLYNLLLKNYDMNNTDTEIQTEYKKTNYEKYKEAQEQIEKQKNEQNK